MGTQNGRTGVQDGRARKRRTGAQEADGRAEDRHAGDGRARRRRTDNGQADGLWGWQDDGSQQDGGPLSRVQAEGAVLVFRDVWRLSAVLGGGKSHTEER